MDEPRTTQPTLYKEIDNHPPVAKLFADRLVEEEQLNLVTMKNFKKKSIINYMVLYSNMNEQKIGKPELPKMPKYLLNGLEKFETRSGFGCT